jgi:glycerol-3-phosphate acyltransferase PlsX
MHDLPSFALRRKKDSSLHVAINMIRHGEADAAISAGNTGAAMAIGKVACRVLEGIDRPALATVLPNINGATVVIDVGANVDCKPLHLLQFAAMGHTYAKVVYGMASPRIGLLSIGEEASKGNVLTKEVFEPLSHSTLNFVGNAEGRDVFNGRVDVIVCDGFTGNVILKVSESLAKTMGLLLKEGFSKNWRTKLGYLLVKPEMEAMRRRVDYAEYGGAPLLGLNGVVIVSHGSSKARAIKNAIRMAAESVNHQLSAHIIQTIEECEFDVKSRARAMSFWRQFKNTIRHESDKSDKAKHDAESLNAPEQPQQPDEPGELAPPADRQEQEQKSPTEDAETEKKPWWHLKELKHHDSAKDKEKEHDQEKDKEKEKDKGRGDQQHAEPDQEKNSSEHS